MSFYSDASLVLIPSGYKDQKIYSAKPTDGSADLAFTRASDATRVASNGLIEKVRTNLNLYSEQMENAYYSKNTGVTVTANNAANPIDGALTADTVNYDGTGVSSSYRIWSTPVVTSTNGLYYTWSVYLRSATPITVLLNINLSVTKVVNVTSTWQRFSITGVGNGTSSVQTLIYSYASNAPFSIEVFGQQVETGDIATGYIATTSAAVSVGPVSGLPRLDYLNSTCPRLLLEPQRTNLVTFSEQFNDTSWTKGGVTISANTSATLDPSGYNGSDKLVEDSSTGVHRIFNNSAVTVSNSVATTYSIFAKAAERTQIYLRDNDIVGARFNLSTGAVISTEGTATATITNYGNGWYRCTITRVSSTTSGRIIVYLDNGGDSYTGNGTSGVYIFGAQIETSVSYATSYIPTLSTSVTRVADAASKTSISSLIGQTEGVLFVDMEFEGYDNLAKWIAFLGTGSAYIGIFTDSFSSFVAEVVNGGVAQFVNTTATFVVGQRYKLALAYKANDFAFYVNGVQIATDNSGTVPATSQFDLQYNTTANNLTARGYNQVLLFKTRLTNQQLQELTTL